MTKKNFQIGITEAEMLTLPLGTPLFHVKRGSTYALRYIGCNAHDIEQNLAVYSDNKSGKIYVRPVEDFQNFIRMEDWLTWAARHVVTKFYVDTNPYEDTQRESTLAAAIATDSIAQNPALRHASINGDTVGRASLWVASESQQARIRLDNAHPTPSNDAYPTSENVLQTLRSGGVQRYHAQPDVEAQSTAEHMWGVAILIQKFYPKCRSLLLKAALTHDCGEVGVGDIPSPIKRASPEVKKAFDKFETDTLIQLNVNFEEALTDDERVALKICDVLEGLHYVTKKLRVPNYTVAAEWTRYAATLPLTEAQKKFVLACNTTPVAAPIDLSPFRPIFKAPL